MPFFPSIPANGHLLHVFNRFGRGLEPLLALHDDVLRGPSDLSIGERELIAAYVSSLNDCSFCFNAHRVYSAAFGIDPEIFDALSEDIDTAPVDEKLKPLLAYAGKLTRDPARMTQADADAVFETGWSEAALHDAVLVTCIFNFMNRVIFGHGLDGHDARYAARLNAAMAQSEEDRTAANKNQIGARDYAAFGELVKKGEMPD